MGCRRVVTVSIIRTPLIIIPSLLVGGWMDGGGSNLLRSTRRAWLVHGKHVPGSGDDNHRSRVLYRR